MGDRSQVLDQLSPVHTDPAVGNGQRAGIGVKIDMDGELGFG